MSRRTVYRKLLLQAVEALLEGTSSSYARAQRILQRCSITLDDEAKEATVDRVVWYPFVVRLMDSVYYDSQAYVREVREILDGYSLQNLARTVIKEDFRSSFTREEAEWYAQLSSMVDFLTTIPFSQIHEATFQAWQNRESWAVTRKTIPEALLAEEIEAEYQWKNARIEALATQIPSPENIGDEKIYRLVLREITTLLVGLSVGGPAVYLGYPIPGASYSGGELNMSESVAWSKRALQALAGVDGLFIFWRLSKAATFDADALLISLH